METAENSTALDLACPCCGDPMASDLVVCWVCFRWTDRLTPGTYADGGYPVEITASRIAEWDAARTARLAGSAPTPDESLRRLGTLDYCPNTLAAYMAEVTKVSRPAYRPNGRAKGKAARQARRANRGR